MDMHAIYVVYLKMKLRSFANNFEVPHNAITLGNPYTSFIKASVTFGLKLILSLYSTKNFLYRKCLTVLKKVRKWIRRR